MFSIQQLVKTTRRLQTNSVHVGSADLAKSLKYAAVTVNGNVYPQQQHLEVSTGSLLVYEMTETSSSPTLPLSSKQQKLQNANTTNGTPELNFSQISQQNDNVNKHSLCSHLNEFGSQATLSATTQNQEQWCLATTTKTIADPKTSQNLCNRSQQIQNFYQQQLHQFHTQHNQSLWAKQKQTHFTMSSLAAAEPLSPLSSGDGLGAIASNGDDTAKFNGENEADNCSSSAASSSGKTCFKSGLGEILQFMELIGNLKHTKRTGWVLRNVNDCESISGHMYRMSVMTFLLDGTEGLNQIRCMELALVHDLAESIVGDLTPFCGISKEEKRTMEFKAMYDICKLIEPRGKRIMELFQEYETGKSEESKFVKDLDRLDMVMQAFEYEKRDNCLLKHQEFFNSTEGKFNHPFIKQLVKEIYEQRTSLAKERGATPPPNVVEVPDWEQSSTPPSNGQNTQDPGEDNRADKSSSSSS